ncbi:hypothetical protein N7474_010944 [Penicillium riverlandense]|uniref:uncharacterized protein n=1 Tax=Penicillium riverlandense TaxID=1903569 RepID=UPI002548E30D|nr:uncharacterized protein N7474_010944 [Penicillium riverlandense]KAJ5805057.1 hypothetical protein N7474_010944 [Penicillium riverlandense]
MDAAAASSWEPPSDPVELRKLIESVQQPGSSELHDVLPPVPPDAPDILRKNWKRYALRKHKAPGPLKIAKWNYDHPVVWVNALLAVALAAVTVSQTGRFSIVQLGIYLALLTFLDYKICQYVFPHLS